MKTEWSFKLKAYKRPIVFPIKVSNFNPGIIYSAGEPTIYASAKFNSGVKFDTILYAQETSININGDFENRASWNSATNWVIDYPNWIFYSTTDTSQPPLPDYSIVYPKVYSGSCSLSTRFNIRDAQRYPDIILHNATSGSFAIDGSKRLRAGFSIFSKNGIMARLIDLQTFTNQSTESQNYPIPIEPPYQISQELRAQYSIKLAFYNISGVRIGEIVLIDGEGDTISQGETVSKSGWLSNTITADPPQGAKYIKIEISAGIIPLRETDYIGTLPIVCVDNLFVSELPVGSLPLITVYPSININTGVVFNADIPTKVEIPHETSYLATSGDCDTDGTTLYTEAPNLHFGNKAGSAKWKSWIPFTISGSSTEMQNLVTGIHVSSAILTLTPFDTVSFDMENRCRFKIGASQTPETSPASPEELLSRTTYGAVTKSIISESWISGQEFQLDITETMKSALSQICGGDSDTIYISGVNTQVALIIDDDGSADGENRTFTSYEGSQSNPQYSQPKINLEYAYNETSRADDTYIDESSIHKRNYKEPTLLIGELNGKKRRGLLRFDLSEIPSAATVTSVKLYLYAISTQGAASDTLNVHKMLRNWDSISSSWTFRYTAHYWGASGGQSGTDYESAVSGSKVIATNPTGYQEIPFTTSGINYIQGIIDKSVQNYGFMVKFATESENLKTFGASDNQYKLYRPYIVITTSAHGTFTIKGNLPGSDDPLPPTVTGKVEKASQNQLLGSNATSFNYNFTAPANSNRYFVLFEFRQSNSKTITSIRLDGTVNMNKIESIYADSSLVAWGAVIPNNWAAGSHQVAWEYSTSSGQGRHYLFMVELKGVNQTSPINETFKIRQSADSASVIQTDSSHIYYVGGGYVIDAIILLGDNTNFSPSTNQQAIFSSISSNPNPIHTLASSIYTVINSAGGRANMRWDFRSGSTGDSSMIALSFKPQA